MVARTYTRTYTRTDIEAVMRRFKSDLMMIAQSSRAIKETTAQRYADDVELFAKAGVLSSVDITLLDDMVEVEAAQYTVNTSGDLSTDRPGGVMWRRVPRPRLRIVIQHTDRYNEAMKQQLSDKLHFNWSPTNEDISHSELTPTNTRQYASNGWAMRRQDYRGS